LLKAERRIIRSSCRVGKLTRKASTRRKMGRVLAQRPRAGTVLANRAKVRLTVGRGRRR
jgi:beta-lactam-binding protein with PASTA domain